MLGIYITVYIRVFVHYEGVIFLNMMQYYKVFVKAIFDVSWYVIWC